MLEVSLKPEHCTCPNDGYTCVVRQGIEEWVANTSTFVKFSLSDENGTITDSSDIFQADFLQNFSALYSTLFVTDLSVNESNITCQGIALVVNMLVTSSETVEICVIGKYTLPNFCEYEFIIIILFRSCITTYYYVSSVGLLISRGQLPISSVW